MSYIPQQLRNLVYDRASGKCEYCLLHEDYTIKRHEVDHIYAEKHDGQTSENNLCLCCVDCNRHKGSDFASIDPLTGEPVFLFNPRRNNWPEHFRVIDGYIEPLTPSARATIRLLHINDAKRVSERKRLSALGRYP